MELPTSPQAARRAGLRYVSDDQPGLRRVRRGHGFRYLKANGRPLADRRTLARITSLAIPPAWTGVWICPSPDGHIQATGFDVRGRKQYRYHPEWTRLRNQVKFDGMAAFGEALPIIRRRVRRDLRRKGSPKEKVIACVVRLMDEALIRVGNQEYARDNHSFGLTTMRNHHARVNGRQITFKFLGKSGQKVDVTVEDPRAARIVRRCQELPGQQLFEYIDDYGSPRDIDSEQVNEYLREASGQNFTVMDFCTWGGTVAAAAALHRCGPCRNGDGAISERELKRRCVDSVKSAAEALGNRVATCRKFYVHPKLAECYAQGWVERTFRAASRQKSPPELTREEGALLELMRMLERNGSHSVSPARR